MDEIARKCIGFFEVTMMKKRCVAAIFPFLGMLMLILDARTALAGAKAAVELCLTTVIPSLFPFFVLSNLLTGALSGSDIPGLRSMGRWLGIPGGCEGIFLTGLLGGYPTGAQAVYRAWKDERLSTAEARRLLSFCSNAGPAFLFGILGQKFPHLWIVWLLWGIHILSATMVAVLCRHSSTEFRPAQMENGMDLTGAVKQAVTVCGWVCGWIVLFRVAMAFCQSWFLWLLPKAGQVAFYGLLELTGGCCALDNVENIGLRFVMASGMVSLGGMCVAMQTASVTGALGIGSYLLGKITQCAISIVLAYVGQWLLLPAQIQLRSPVPVCIAVMVIVCTGVCVSFDHRKQSTRNAEMIPL